MPERDFWKTMNPSRLHELFNSYFKRTVAEEKKQSLSEYIMGG
jgi:hypothetical protein